MRPYASLCFFMGPNESLQVPIRPYGCSWVRIGPYASLWIFMGAYKFLCVLVCPYGSL